MSSAELDCFYRGVTYELVDFLENYLPLPFFEKETYFCLGNYLPLPLILPETYYYLGF